MMGDWQQETAGRLLDAAGYKCFYDDDLCEICNTSRRWIMTRMVEAMQAQQSTDLDLLKAIEAERDLRETAERQRDEADRAFRAHDVLVVQLQVRAETAERQRDEALALLRAVGPTHPDDYESGRTDPGAGWEWHERRDALLEKVGD